MEFNQSLYRDQRRLAQMKAQALPSGHPLHVRYLQWISELDICLDRLAVQQTRDGLADLAQSAAQSSDAWPREGLKTNQRSKPQTDVARPARHCREPSRKPIAFQESVAHQTGDAPRTNELENDAAAARIAELRHENSVLRFMLERFFS